MWRHLVNVMIMQASAAQRLPQSQRPGTGIDPATRAGLRHRPTGPWPIGPRGFSSPALSKVKETCRHSYTLSHEKSEKIMFRIVTCFMYPRVFTKEGSCGDCCLSCDSSNITSSLKIVSSLYSQLNTLIRPC